MLKLVQAVEDEQAKSAQRNAAVAACTCLKSELLEQQLYHTTATGKGFLNMASFKQQC